MVPDLGTLKFMVRLKSLNRNIFTNLRPVQQIKFFFSNMFWKDFVLLVVVEVFSSDEVSSER